MENKIVIAIVVTYNRKELLVECLDALTNQTYTVNKIIIVDNNSIDGTYETLKQKGYINNDKIIYKCLEKNIGGAGGFYEGMMMAREVDGDFVWIMDDDVIPENNALEELIIASNEINQKFSFLASTVYGTDGNAMNVPNINTDVGVNGYCQWCKHLDKSLIQIREATFVSLLIDMNALKEIGLPVKDYFIWGDDTEYTLRLNKYYGSSYLVGKSKVIHKRKGGQALSIKNEEDKNRINMYFYMIRNNYINFKEYYGSLKAFKHFVKYNLYAIQILFSNSKNKFLKLKVIFKGLYSSIFKKYDYKAFKNRLNS